jgi:hypothetical protein
VGSAVIEGFIDHCKLILGLILDISMTAKFAALYLLYVLAFLSPEFPDRAAASIVSISVDGHNVIRRTCRAWDLPAFYPFAHCNSLKERGLRSTNTTGVPMN